MKMRPGVQFYSSGGVALPGGGKRFEQWGPVVEGPVAIQDGKHINAWTGLLGWVNIVISAGG